MNNYTATKIVESILGQVEWVTKTEGFTPCPGQHLHTGPDGKCDCKLFLNDVPTLTCFHSSCAEVIKQKNSQLRVALREVKLELHPKQQKEMEKTRNKEARRKEATRQRAAGSLPRLLEDYRWPYARIVDEGGVSALPEDHWRLLLGCFAPEDVVWIGDVRDSGQSHHANKFRSVEQWLQEPTAPGPLLCPSTFKPGTYARSNEQVANRRFLVVESDTLKRDAVGAVFKWLQVKVRLPQVAIVDTAGKSLHGWFEFPAEDIVEELKLILPELQCDPKLFTASQPVRLPGALRGEKYQKLVYLRKEVAQ